MKGYLRLLSYIKPYKQRLIEAVVCIVVAAAAMFFGDDLKKLFSSEGEQAKAVTESVKTVDLTKTLKDANNGGGQQQKNP